MNEYKTEQVREALLKIASVMKAQRDVLTEIDSKNGDGDLGISMGKGAEAIESTVENFGASEDIGALLSQCGAAFNRSAPSTLGTLIGMSFMFLGKEWAGKAGLSEEDIVRLPAIVRDTISRMGKANPGDKTILDALAPFAESLSEEYRNSADLAAAWKKAADEARNGMEATRSMKAKVGRARWLGDRATGTPDGGALLCSLVIDAFTV